MKKILLPLIFGISAFAAPRYDYTIQDVFEYYNINNSIVVEDNGWHFRNQGGYFNGKNIFFTAYINSYGQCKDTDNCSLNVAIDLPYSNFKRANMDITTNYSYLLQLKKGEISRQAQFTCVGDAKGWFTNCKFLKENKTN